jgi:hypothetical protein
MKIKFKASENLFEVILFFKKKMKKKVLGEGKE